MLCLTLAAQLLIICCCYIIINAAGHGNKTQKGTGVIDNLLGKEEEAVKEMHSQKNHVKELEATIMDLKAENAKLKIALDSARSQGKV